MYKIRFVSIFFNFYGLKTITYFALSLSFIVLPTLQKTFATDEQSFFLTAIRKNDLLAIKLLIHRNAKVIYAPGSTSLHEAIQNGTIEMVQLLIKAGADIHATDENQQTPLHLAAECGAVKIAQLFILAGATVDARDSWQQTPLHIAANYGHIEIVLLLIGAGANVHAVDQWQQTCLHLAVESNIPHIVLLLLKAGSNVNVLDDYHQTPLHLAANNGYVQMVQLLIKAGADIHALDENQQTPLHLASERGAAKTVQLFILAGATVDATDNYGQTSLELAIKFIQHSDFLKFPSKCDKKVANINTCIHLLLWYLYRLYTGNITPNQVDVLQVLQSKYLSSPERYQTNLLLQWIFSIILNCQAKIQIIEKILEYLMEDSAEKYTLMINTMNDFFLKEDVLKEFNLRVIQLEEKFSLTTVKKLKSIFRYVYAQKAKKEIFNVIPKKSLMQLMTLNKVDANLEQTIALRSIKKSLMQYDCHVWISSPMMSEILKINDSIRIEGILDFIRGCLVENAARPTSREVSAIFRVHMNNILKLIKDIKVHFDHIIQYKGASCSSPTQFGRNTGKDIILFRN